MIHRVGRAAILDDVLTTGGSAAGNVREQIRRINPRISLSLFGIVLGGEVLPQHAPHLVIKILIEKAERGGCG